MASFDATSAACTVYAYKEGLLSAVGHDVKLRVGRFRVEADADRVEATFEASSLEVVCAMKDGRENPGALSDKDRRTIEGYVRDDILEVRRYPTITFRSTELAAEDDAEGGLGRAVEVTGDLTLHGRTRSVTAKVETVGDRRVARIRIHQPDFGITPFKAMLGTLKIQPRVDVELSIPV